MKSLIVATIAAAIGISSPVFAKHDKEKSLPPGLEKKLERGGELPPGWKKKLAKGSILERDLYDRAHIISPVDIHDQEIIRLDDTTMRVLRATGEIIHIFGQN
jgi:hypothetical protein